MADHGINVSRADTAVATPNAATCGIPFVIGTGCAISQASASLMIDLVKGRTVEDARRLIGLYFDMIKGKITPEQLDDLEDVAALQGIAHVPARVKCAVLAWHTLEEALDGEGKI